MKQTHKIIFGFVLIPAVITGIYLLRANHAPLPHHSETSQHGTTTSVTATLPATQQATNSHTTKTQHTSAHTTQLATTLPNSMHAKLKQDITHEYTYRILSTPSDPQYSTDWPLQTTDAPAAWPITTGNNQTIIAVIDTGFALAHEDLANQWYTNPGETGMTQAGDRCWTGTPADKQTNGCDDDNNGYVDDWRGWNFSGSDNNPQTGRTNATGAGVTHGTSVAGLAGAAGDNGLGSTAIDQHTKLMPLQALSDDGVGYTSDVTAAIYYAVDNGAQVINLSLGGTADDSYLKSAIDYATAHNVVVVAAAGNCGDGTGPDCQGLPVGVVSYPAAYPDVIAVGATTQSNTMAYFSSFGAAIDVTAPGYNLPVAPSWSAAQPSTLYRSGLYGTSYASPQVASLAALIRSIRPHSSPQDITALIDATATQPSGMNGLAYTQQFGHGIVNAGAALDAARTLNSNTSNPTFFQTGSATAEHIALVDSTLSSGCETAVMTPCTVVATDTHGYSRYLPYRYSSGTTANWSWSANILEAGDWSLRARSGDNVSTTPYALQKRS